MGGGIFFIGEKPIKSTPADKLQWTLRAVQFLELPTVCHFNVLQVKKERKEKQQQQQQWLQYAGMGKIQTVL